MEHDAPRTSKLDRVLTVPFFSGYLGGLVSVVVFVTAASQQVEVPAFFVAAAGGLAAVGLEAFGNAMRRKRRVREAGATPGAGRTERQSKPKKGADDGPAKLDEPTKPVRGPGKQPRAKRKRG